MGFIGCTETVGHMCPGSLPAEGTSSLAVAVGVSLLGAADLRTEGPTAPFTPPACLPNEPADIITSFVKLSSCGFAVPN